MSAAGGRGCSEAAGAADHGEAATLFLALPADSAQVGSRYRDFIQSTDAIEFMNHRAASATRSLDSFWTKGQELIENIHQLYSDASAAQAAEPAPDTTAIASTMTIGVSSVSSEVIWTCLGDCNVFDASMVRLDCCCDSHLIEFCSFASSGRRC